MEENPPQQQQPHIDMTGVVETMIESITNRLDVLVEQKIAIALASRSADYSAGNKHSHNAKLAEKRSPPEQQQQEPHNDNVSGDTQSDDDSSGTGSTRNGDALSLLAGSEKSITGSANFRSFLNPKRAKEDAQPRCSDYNRAHNVDTNVHDKEQSYWQDSQAQYDVAVKLGAEVSSPLAGAMKTFWTKSIGEKSVTEFIAKCTVPGNCSFLKVKSCNHPIFTTAASNIRTLDTKFQDAQKTHVSMTGLLVNATHELRQIMNVLEDKKVDIESLKDVGNMLQDCMKLAGESNQRINHIRRMTYKPTIPTHLKSLADKALETEEELFGDNLEEKLKTIKAENTLKAELSKTTATFKKPANSNKFSHYDRKDKPSSSSSSGNARSSSKSRWGHAAGQSNTQDSSQNQ